MSVTTTRDPSATEPTGEKASRVRQRQRLIDACISALYAYGPSRTTVEKVVSIANLSPGIVNFYFDSKAAMMVAALEYLAGEFEREVLDPVILCKDNPVRALELLVDLYLDPEIASPRKVSVWFAFWGEANSRKEYYDICGKRDETFAVLVRDLIERLIVVAGEPHLDADGVALGLIGALDVLWQHFAFEVEANIDRVAAKRRCKAYLRSVFPRQFGDAALVPPPRVLAPALPAPPATGWRYADPARFLQERDRLFLADWQLLGHEAELPRPGDYLAMELLGERALVLRDKTGTLRAFRNNCRHRPHALTADRTGHFARAIQCPVDGFAYGFDGTPQGKRTAGALAPLGIGAVGGLVFVRLAPIRPGAESRHGPTLKILAESGLGEMRSDGPPVDSAVAADWKVVVENWLDLAFATGGDGRMAGLAGSRDITLDAVADCLLWRAALRGDARKGAWSAARYGKLAARLDPGGGAPGWLRVLAFPNQLIDIRPDGATVLQAIPVAAGETRIRRFDYVRPLAGRAVQALHYLGRRLADRWLAADIGIARSTQAGLVSPGYRPGEGTGQTPALGAFRTWLDGLLPGHGGP